MIFAFDTETHRIKPGQHFPRLVCSSWAWNDGQAPRVDVLDRADTYARARMVLDSGAVMVAHNAAFDMGILAAEWPDLLPLIWEAYESGRVKCTETRQKLLDIAAGVFKWDEDENGKPVKNTYALADLVRSHFKRELPKEDTWRLRYSELDGVPIVAWPADAIEYAERDAEEARAVYHDAQGPGEIPDEDRQALTAFVYHLMSGWGVRTDPAMVALLRRNLEDAQNTSLAELLKCVVCGSIDAGTCKLGGPHERIMRLVKGSPSRDMKAISARVAAAYRAQNREVPLTETGRVKTSEEVLRETNDPPLLILADSLKGSKLLNTYVPVLEQGTQYPITSRPNVLVDTGRSSWAKPNLQNPPQGGGVRECFVPRAGMVFCSVDYDTIELRGHAQNCLEIVGFSEMAEALKRGEDLHLALAAELLGISYAETVERRARGDSDVAKARQSAKAANFGFPGGMGVPKFLATQKRFVPPGLTEREKIQWGAKLKEAWLTKFRENASYFNYISRLTSAMGECRYTHPWSGRVRGGLDYCSAANGLFQGRVADGAKLALRRWSRECYLGAAAGCRPVMFLHDEIITEMPEGIAAEMADLKTRIMLDAMREVIPDVPVTAKPVLMRRWFKGAEPISLDGRLVPSKPEKTDKGTRWVADLMIA